MDIRAPKVLTTSTTRIIGFDILRGLCALGVAIGHLGGDAGYNIGPNFTLYTVYVFFTLSGASLFVAYSERLHSESDLLAYFINRMLRIVPLYVVVLAASVASALHSHPIGFGAGLTAFLNGTLLFGLGNPGASLLVVGGWSLGIEFVFYLAFPIMSALVKTRLWLWILILLLLSQRAFIELVLQHQTLESAWVSYTQPLAFIGYFFCGCCIGRFVIERNHREYGILPIIGLIASLAVLAIYQGATKTESLKGLHGIILTVAACSAVFSSSFLIAHGWLKKLASPLGDSSYGVYLMHSPIAALLAVPLMSLPIAASIAISISVTCFLALASNRWFEMPLRGRFKHHRQVRN